RPAIVGFGLSCGALLAAAAGVYVIALQGILAFRPVTFDYLAANYLHDVSPLGVGAHLLLNSIGLLEFTDLMVYGLSYRPELEGVATWHWLAFGTFAALGATALFRAGGAGRRIVL